MKPSAPPQRRKHPQSVWNQPRMLEDLAWYPNEQIVRFIVKYLKRRTGIDTWETLQPASLVLDLGCGTGRHVKLFAEQGFQTHGLDLAFLNIQFAKNWMKRLALPAGLLVGASEQLPYRSGSFDGVVSHGVLDHMTLAQAETTLGEIRRILKPTGLLYVDLISKENSGYGEGTPLGEDTFVVPDGIETGVVQRFYDEPSLRALLEPHFKPQEIIFQTWYPLIGRGFSNLDKQASGPQRLARFHVAATPLANPDPSP